MAFLDNVKEKFNEYKWKVLVIVIVFILVCICGVGALVTAIELKPEEQDIMSAWGDYALKPITVIETITINGGR